jgi:hypothetical protein
MPTAGVFRNHGISAAERGWACSVLQIDRSSVRYTSVRPDDTHLLAAMKKAAAERRRFGYRRIHVVLEGRVLKRDAVLIAVPSTATHHRMEGRL